MTDKAKPNSDNATQTETKPASTSKPPEFEWVKRSADDVPIKKK
jgi:hypothetical protein